LELPWCTSDIPRQNVIQLCGQQVVDLQEQLLLLLLLLLYSEQQW
jgi:hypothetical protein